MTSPDNAHFGSPQSLIARSIIRVFLLAACIAAAGEVRAYAQIVFGPPDERYVSDIDRVHQGDLIEVDVVGSFEFDWRGRLNPEGFIDGIERLPDPTFGRCRSTVELANTLADKFRAVLRDPVVEVRIIDRNGRALSYIDGAVKNPLRLRIKRDVRLNEVIVLAGGFTDLIGNEIGIFRPEGASCEGAGAGELPKRSTTRMIKIADVLAGVDGSNPKILPGDIVTVVRSLPIYVIGGVGSPQRISARDGITLSRAIDSAGGVTKNGRGDLVSVFRRSPNGVARTIEVDLGKIRAGTVEDPRLEANDIVEVPLKGSEKRQFPPMLEIRDAGRGQPPLRIID